MTNKIGGYGNRPVETGTGKSVSRERDAGTSASQTAEAGKPATPVRITDQARQLAAKTKKSVPLMDDVWHQGLLTETHAIRVAQLELVAGPVVNEARVAAVRLAIEEGRYEVVPERVADKLLRIEHELRMTEK